MSAAEEVVMIALGTAIECLEAKQRKTKQQRKTEKHYLKQPTK
jgi:hypothetical protein